MDGKLAPFFKQFRGPTILTWLSAIANIGNNKIGGQSAKDVIDFSGASVKRFVDGKTLGEELIFAPTYETNLALNHRNMLAAGDVLWDWGRLNQTQLVRTALTHDPSKMPKDGDFKGGYAITGWNLHFHTGFEAGGSAGPGNSDQLKEGDCWHHPDLFDRQICASDRRDLQLSLAWVRIVPDGKVPAYDRAHGGERQGREPVP
jgi:hypothetical protein